MKRLNFKIDIQAPAEKVFRTMLGLDDISTYEAWTSMFNPTSSYEGKWNKGSKIYFTGIHEGKKGGMIAEIAESIPNQFISIRHYGILDGEEEITSGPQVEAWSGGLENYHFEHSNGITTVNIEVDTDEEYIDFFEKVWPDALRKLKEICENK